MVAEGWTLMVSSAIPQVAAISLWVAVLSVVFYLRREEIVLGRDLPAEGLTAGDAFDATTVGTLATAPLALGLPPSGGVPSPIRSSSPASCVSSSSAGSAPSSFALSLAAA